MRKPWRFMALLLALSLVAAACGSDDSSDTTADAGGGDATTTTAAVTTTTSGDGDEPMAASLRWSTRPDNAEEADVYRTIGDGLATELGIELTYEPGDNESASYQQKLLTNLSAGTAPDVFWVPGTDIADFASRDVILDLRQYADATGHNDADFYPGPMSDLTTDPATGQPGSGLWGLPRDVSAFALYLNLDLIAEAGADDPRDLAANGEWTWEAFQQVAEDVAAIGGEVKGYGQSAWWGPYGAWMNAAGGGFFNAERTACTLDSDESVAGLEFQRDLWATDAIIPYGEDPETPFRGGTVGMVQTGRWATPGIRTVDFDWDVVGLPVGAAGSGNWLFWGAYVVNAATENPEAAWNLVQALTTAETQAKVSASGANIPSRVSQEALDAFLAFSPPANNQAFLDGLVGATAEGPLWVGSWPEYVSLMDGAIQEVITGSRDLADFQANICSEVADAFDN